MAGSCSLDFFRVLDDEPRLREAFYVEKIVALQMTNQDIVQICSLKVRTGDTFQIDHELSAD
jgi:hypothetical protein